MDSETLLVLDMSAQVATVKMPIIPYPDSGLRLFAAQKIGKKEAVGTTMGLRFIPTWPNNGIRPRYMWREWYRWLPKRFKKREWSTWEVTDKAGITDRLWIASVLFCTVQYINDASYLLGDSTLEIERMISPSENNMQFLQSHSSLSCEDFGSCRVVSA